MGTTSRGYRYPEATGHTRLWEHFATLAGDVNTDVSTLAAAPAARISGGSSQSIAASGNTRVTFSTVDYQLGTGVAADLANNRLTVSRSGLYLVAAALAWVAVPTVAGARGALIYVGPSSTTTIAASDYRPALANAASIATLSAVTVLTAGDIVALHALNLDSSARSVGLTNGAPWLSATYLRPST